MSVVRYTLLADGSSDRVLIPILDWILNQQMPTTPLASRWADLRNLRRPPSNLSDRIRFALKLFPCDILFIHRDAENDTIQNRVEEIQHAIGDIDLELTTICVIPVRMQEAWLLLEEAAIRRAAGNPNGRVSLALPDIDDLERISDPKSLLHNMLRQAGELSGRRSRSFNVHQAVHLVAQNIRDFTPLRNLIAFQHLEDQIVQTVEANNWN
jgi:hypothetical protein